MRHKLTVAITNYNYAPYIRGAIETALEFGDEVIVHDDCSTDESYDIIREYPVIHSRAEVNSGGPVTGYNLAIERATGDYITLLDADNYLINRPLLKDDYRFGAIDRVDANGHSIDGWDYGSWPLTATECLRKFADNHSQPLPSGGYWRVQWLRDNDLKLMTFATSEWAYDIKTHVEWLKLNPTISRFEYPSLVLRWHKEQLTQQHNLEQEAFNEIRQLARGL